MPQGRDGGKLYPLPSPHSYSPICLHLGQASLTFPLLVISASCPDGRERSKEDDSFRTYLQRAHHMPIPYGAMLYTRLTCSSLPSLHWSSLSGLSYPELNHLPTMVSSMHLLPLRIGLSCWWGDLPSAQWGLARLMIGGCLGSPHWVV